MRCDLLVAAAIAVVFAAAVALIIEFEGEGFAAVWTLDFAFVQNGAVDADLFVAVWTFYFVDVLIVAAAVVIAAAIIIVVLFTIDFIFKGAEVLVDCFYFLIQLGGAVLQIGYGESHVVQNIQNSLHDLAVVGGFVYADAFNKSLQVCYFLSQSHFKIPLKIIFLQFESCF